MAQHGVLVVLLSVSNGISSPKILKWGSYRFTIISNYFTWSAIP